MTHWTEQTTGKARQIVMTKLNQQTFENVRQQVKAEFEAKPK